MVLFTNHSIVRKMKLKLYFTLILVGSATTFFAQVATRRAGSGTSVPVVTVATVRAAIVDSLSSQPIEFASVRLFAAKTNQMVQGAVTAQNGQVEIKDVKPGGYYLLISFTGYNTKRLTIREQQFRRTIINLGNVRLGASNVMLGTVTVTGKLPEMVVKEDTVEYNAAAFKTPDGAVVEDLIKRLPGVQVDADGKITTAAGKQVSKVRVNGKDFFGDDPKMATKNLTADIVEKVQVIEKKSDLAILTGVDDDEPETIINLTIKKGMMKGWMGNLSGGAGQLFDNKNNESARYTTGSMLNRFTETDQVSVVANSNNINERASTDRGNNVRTGRGGSGSTAGNGGITSSSTAGLNLAKVASDKLKWGANVSYNYSDNYTNSRSSRENIFTDSVSYRRSTSTVHNFSHNFSAGGKMEYQMDTLTTIVFTPTFSYNSSLARNTSYQKTMAGDIDSTAVNESNSASTLNSDGTNVGAELDISRKLSAKGRRVSLSGSFNLSDSQGTGTNNSDNIFYQATGRNTLYNQQSANSANRNSYNLRFTYVEPIAKNYFIDLLYNIQFNNTVNEKETYDYDSSTGLYDDLNANYSRSSSVHSTSQNIRANFRSVQTKYTYNIGLSVAPSSTRSIGYIKDWYGDGLDSVYNRIPTRKTVNYAPQFEFTYRFGNNKMMRKYMRLRYNGRTTQPSVSQLDPSQDVTNPLNITSGNPDLLPSFSHNISLEYNSNNRTSQHSFSAILTHTFIQNSIVNYTTYEQGTGVQYTKPINENGTWNSQANLLFSSPLDEKMHFNFNFQTVAGYSNQVGYTLLQKQSERNITHTATVTPSLSISYKNDWFYGQFRGRLGYSSSTYSMSGLSPRQSNTYDITYNTQLTLPWSTSLSSDITYTANRGLSAGYNQDEVMWNAQLSKSFLANKAASLRLQFNDILHQRLNLSRSITTNSITDTQYTALTSYYMVTFAYRFNNVGGNRRGGNRFRSGYSGGDYDPSQMPGGGDRPAGGGFPGGGRFPGGGGRPR